VSKVKYIDRALVVNPYYVGLVTNEQAFRQELKRLKVPEKDWPDYMGSNHADATAHFLEKADGSSISLVCLREKKKVDRVQVLGVLIHEAVHVWQYVRRYLGESAPSDEFEAYAVQKIAQGLIAAYVNQTGQPRHHV